MYVSIFSSFMAFAVLFWAKLAFKVFLKPYYEKAIQLQHVSLTHERPASGLARVMLLQHNSVKFLV